MIIVFDFDHTIFDMMAMHEALYSAIRKLGVSRADYDDAYLAVTHWKMFTPSALAQRLQKANKVSAEKTLQAMQSVAERSREFLYEDTTEAMRRLKEAGHELYILTWGDEAWQGAKVKHSGLMPYCKEAFCLSQAKQDFLKGWAMAHPGAVLVDDKPAEIRSVSDMKVPMRFVRMRRTNAKYADQDTPAGVAEVRDMQEVMALISKWEALNS